MRHLADSPNFEENHELDLTPHEMVVAFARGKAESLADKYPEALIIGCDQLGEIDGSILAKPGTDERAVDQLMRLAGRTHRLLSAVAVHCPRTGTTTHDVSVHAMTMKPFDRATAEAYVAADQPANCAGSYRIESRGLLLFDSMKGTDHSGIVGLPLSVVARLVAGHGSDLLRETLLGDQS